MKRKSSCNTAKKFPRVVQSDSSLDDVQTPADSKSSDSDKGYMGWVEKMGQKQGLLGGSRFKRRWMELKNGTLTWYSTDDMKKRKGRLHVEAYKLKVFEKNCVVRFPNDKKELEKYCCDDGKYLHFELQRSSEGGNLNGMRSVKDLMSVEQNEEILEGQTREKLTMRLPEKDMNAAWKFLDALQCSIEYYKNRSSNYCIRFAGLQLMKPPKDSSNLNQTENVRISSHHQTLALEPMRQLIVRVVVPDNLYARLLPCLKRRDKLIRARPILFTQGISSNLISATQRSLQGTSMLHHRNGINADAFVRLLQFVDDLKSNAPKDDTDWADRNLEIDVLCKELKIHLDRAENKTNPIDGLPALLVASDLIHKLGGLKFVNCMSGKDRTGMSVTLEQSRQLMQIGRFFQYKDYSIPTYKSDEIRSAQEIATTHKRPKESKTLDVADRMRIAGPRVQICRKSIHKPKFKGSISLFCMKPPKNIAGDVEA